MQCCNNRPYRAPNNDSKNQLYCFTLYKATTHIHLNNIQHYTLLFFKKSLLIKALRLTDAFGLSSTLNIKICKHIFSSYPNGFLSLKQHNTCVINIEVSKVLISPPYIITQCLNLNKKDKLQNNS